MRLVYHGLPGLRHLGSRRRRGHGGPAGGGGGRCLVLLCALAACEGGGATGPGPGAAAVGASGGPEEPAADRRYDVDVRLDGDPSALVGALAEATRVRLEQGGVRVLAVPAHPALAAIDLRAGDLVTRVGGIPPLSAQSAVAIRALLAAPGPLEFELVRAGVTRRHRVRHGAQAGTAAAGERDGHGQ